MQPTKQERENKLRKFGHTQNIDDKYFPKMYQVFVEEPETYFKSSSEDFRIKTLQSLDSYRLNYLPETYINIKNLLNSFFECLFSFKLLGIRYLSHLHKIFFRHIDNISDIPTRNIKYTVIKVNKKTTIRTSTSLNKKSNGSLAPRDISFYTNVENANSLESLITEIDLFFFFEKEQYLQLFFSFGIEKPKPFISQSITGCIAKNITDYEMEIQKQKDIYYYFDKKFNANFNTTDFGLNYQFIKYMISLSNLEKLTFQIIDDFFNPHKCFSEGRNIVDLDMLTTAVMFHAHILFMKTKD
jgi:hypothetical protein